MFFGSMGGEFCAICGCGSARNPNGAIIEIRMTMNDFMVLEIEGGARNCLIRIRPFKRSSVEPAPAATALSLQRDRKLASLADSADRLPACRIGLSRLAA